MKFEVIPFSPTKFLTSLDVQTMTLEEIGAYCILLFNSWLQPNPCYLPNDEEQLRAICKVDEETWKRIKVKVLKKFSKEGDYIYNKKLYHSYLELKEGKVMESRTKRHAANTRHHKEDAQSKLKYPWTTEGIKTAWAEWVDYKKRDFKKSFKSIKTEQIALDRLHEISNGSEADAIRFINHAITMQWQGIYPVKETKKAPNKHDITNQRDNPI